ncbi:15141_t:CDS:2 [Funneliformis caledonium]|uniref:15141_t:CDS:1 n=1 Tax=Funneliformis caledonium TaxID=1117310 RepID=A0A9N9FEV4_9GLOM|nr:15141_t:CDS:2 [Funneliformis caledonium]
MSRASIRKTCEALVERLKNSDNVLTNCDKSSLYLLQECLNTVCQVNSDGMLSVLLKATALVDYATEKLHSYPYKDVPLCWRRLYTDASLIKSLCEIFVTLKKENEIESWKQIIKTLDMALIMTGAPGIDRKEMIFNLIGEVEKIMKDIEYEKDFITLAEFPMKRQIDKDVEKFEKRVKLENKVENMPIIRFPISKMSSPSLVAFASHINTPNPTPFILTFCISHWPALSTNPWADLDYLLSVTGKGRIVPVEIGAKYTDDSWSQKLMKFEEFVENRVKNPIKDEGIAYLAQHDLFAQIPRLKEDISIPDYCFVDTKPYLVSSNNIQYNPPPDVIINAWFGPRGTISPMHTDPYNNLLAQVVGQKYIRLYAPFETSKVYPFEQGSFLGNTSQVNIETPDLERFPLFASANYLECVLEPGDLLYIPVS